MCQRPVAFENPLHAVIIWILLGADLGRIDEITTAFGCLQQQGGGEIVGVVMSGQTAAFFRCADVERLKLVDHGIKRRAALDIGDEVDQRLPQVNLVYLRLITDLIVGEQIGTEGPELPCGMIGRQRRVVVGEVDVAHEDLVVSDR